MNLLDYRVTSPEKVFAEISKRAEEAGVEVVESELVGLIPRDAVVASTIERLKLTGFRPEQVIEHHLDHTRSDVYQCFDPFLEALQSGAPTPGGGSASALAGAIGAALGTMVTNLTIGKKKFAEVEAELTAVRGRLQLGIEGLRANVRKDAALYDSVMAAYKLPKATPAEEAARTGAIEEALVLAAQGPLAVMELASALFPDLMTVARKGNPNAASDAAVGALLLQACVHGAAMNVLINAKALGAHPAAAKLRARTAELRQSVDRAAPAVVAEVEKGLSGSAARVAAKRPPPARPGRVRAERAPPGASATAEAATSSTPTDRQPVEPSARHGLRTKPPNSAEPERRVHPRGLIECNGGAAAEPRERLAGDELDATRCRARLRPQPRRDAARRTERVRTRGGRRRRGRARRRGPRGDTGSNPPRARC